jgi:ABC-type molybdate transport system substrate-binding protein
MAVVKEAKQAEAAKKWLQHLDSDDATKIFKKYGFIIRK